MLHTGSSLLDELALYVAVKGFDFEVLDPPELIPVLREVFLSGRLARAAGPSSADLFRTSRSESYLTDFCCYGRRSAGWRVTRSLT